MEMMIEAIVASILCDIGVDCDLLSKQQKTFGSLLKNPLPYDTIHEHIITQEIKTIGKDHEMFWRSIGENKSKVNQDRVSIYVASATSGWENTSSLFSWQVLYVFYCNQNCSW